MENESYNFNTVYPVHISKDYFPPTEKQKSVVESFATFYPDDLEHFTNHYNKKGRKILIISDGFITKSFGRNNTEDQNDLDRNCIFSGKEGAGLQNILAYAVGRISEKTKLSTITVFNWQFASLNFPLNSKRLEHMNNINKANDVYYDRVLSFIEQQKFDAVFIAGVLIWEHFHARLTNDFNTNQRMLMGRIFKGKILLKETTFKLKLNNRPEQYHSFQLTGSIDCVKLCAWDVSPTKHPNLIGYWSDALTQLINGRHNHTVTIPSTVKFVNVNTLDKFNTLMKIVWKQKIVSIDTETEGLGHIVNTLYTVQFCYDGEVGYTIPVDHPFTPFSVKERKYIKIQLKKYFEFGKSLYHIYQNGKFDLQVFFACCGVRFYNHRIYDIQAGEYSLNENAKVLQIWHVKTDKKRQLKPYSLDFIAERYGCSVYRNIDFSKGNRGNIGKEGLTARFVEYASYDVIVPFHIHLAQIKEAKRRKHFKFLKFVCEQISDIILMCAQMEFTGAYIDKKPLFVLKSRDGAVAKEIENLNNKFKENEHCRKVNSYLMKKEGVPEGQGIFGKPTWLFDIKKNKHKQLLFFNSLKLEPLMLGKAGEGKLDKNFKKTYKDIPEVKLFKEYNDLVHFRDGFITPIYTKLTTNPDSLKDGRLRSNYDYIYVATGRLGSRDPNLQNIPSRGELAKPIKRIFSAILGNMLIEQDFSAHEVRELANESKDKNLINSFYQGFDFRRNFRILVYKYKNNMEEWIRITNKSQWYKIDSITKIPLHNYESKQAILRSVENKLTRLIGSIVLDLEANGDIHKLNAHIFFEVDTLAVTEDQRYEIKAVVFGIIYGKGSAGLAKPKAEGGLGKDTDYCQGLIDTFYRQFKEGGTYLKNTNEFGRKNLYVQSPIGMIRHLPAYLHSRPSMRNAMDRRSANAIIQGVASFMGNTSARNLQKLIWHCFVKQGAPIEWRSLTNTVHDSLKLEVAIHLIPIYFYLIEHAGTTMLHKRYRDVFGYELSIGLEMEIGIGATQDRVKKWDFTYQNMIHKISEEIDFQIKELGYNINKDKKIKQVNHNWEIVKDLYIKELEASKEKQEKVTYNMLLNENNSMKMGFIL